MYSDTYCVYYRIIVTLTEYTITYCIVTVGEGGRVYSAVKFHADGRRFKSRQGRLFFGWNFYGVAPSSMGTHALESNYPRSDGNGKGDTKGLAPSREGEE